MPNFRLQNTSQQRNSCHHACCHFFYAVYSLQHVQNSMHLKRNSSLPPLCPDNPNFIVIAWKWWKSKITVSVAELTVTVYTPLVQTWSPPEWKRPRTLWRWWDGSVRFAMQPFSALCGQMVCWISASILAAIFAVVACLLISSCLSTSERIEYRWHQSQNGQTEASGAQWWRARAQGEAQFYLKVQQ